MNSIELEIKELQNKMSEMLSGPSYYQSEFDKCMKRCRMLQASIRPVNISNIGGN